MKPFKTGLNFHWFCMFINSCGYWPLVLQAFSAEDVFQNIMIFKGNINLALVFAENLMMM